LRAIAGSITTFGFDCPLIDSKGNIIAARQAIGHPKLAWKQRRRLFWITSTTSRSARFSDSSATDSKPTCLLDYNQLKRVLKMEFVAGV
jgi:hypothetical protein